MNGERRVLFLERQDDGLSERSESRRTVNEKRLHDRRERPSPEGLFFDDNRVRDSMIPRFELQITESLNYPITESTCSVILPLRILLNCVAYPRCIPASQRYGRRSIVTGLRLKEERGIQGSPGFRSRVPPYS